MPKIDSIKSYLHLEIWHTCVFGQVPTPRIIKISAKNIVKFFGGIGDNHPMLQFLFNF